MKFFKTNIRSSQVNNLNSQPLVEVVLVLLAPTILLFFTVISCGNHLTNFETRSSSGRVVSNIYSGMVVAEGLSISFSHWTRCHPPKFSVQIIMPKNLNFSPAETPFLASVLVLAPALAPVLASTPGVAPYSVPA